MPLEIPAFKSLEEAMIHLKGLHTLGYTAKQVALAVVRAELLQGKPVLDASIYIPAVTKVYEGLFTELWECFDCATIPFDAYLLAQDYERLRTKLMYMMTPQDEFLKNIREEIDDMTQWGSD